MTGVSSPCPAGLAGLAAAGRRYCLTFVRLGPHTGAMEGCSVTVWSAVSSAMANATLAAVLAGFMITGIILVLGNCPL